MYESYKYLCVFIYHLLYACMQTSYLCMYVCEIWIVLKRLRSNHDQGIVERTS
jgi:hypothetical protein